MDALYYPTLSLPGAAWTNPNLLYFDRIHVIAPEGDERELFDGPTRDLMKYELVKPIRPERYAVDEKSDEAVVGHLLGIAQTQRRDHKPARIHLGKIAFTQFVDELISLKLLCRSHTDSWLEGPPWVVDYVMSVLATRMLAHPSLNLSLATTQSYANRIVVGALRSRPSATERRMRALKRLLPMGPNANIEDILTFREKHGRELKQFREFLESLILRPKEGPDGQENFEARLRQAEVLREHLVGELEANRSEATPLEIGLSIASIAAPIMEHSPYSVVVGGFGLGYLLYTRGKARQRKRAVMSDKLVYAALASRGFAAIRAEDITQ